MKSILIILFVVGRVFYATLVDAGQSSSSYFTLECEYTNMMKDNGVSHIAKLQTIYTLDLINKRYSRDRESSQTLSKVSDSKIIVQNSHDEHRRYYVEIDRRDGSYYDNGVTDDGLEEYSFGHCSQN